jgi:hypothetical protein
MQGQPDSARQGARFAPTLRPAPPSARCADFAWHDLLKPEPIGERPVDAEEIGHPLPGIGVAQIAPVGGASAARGPFGAPCGRADRPADFALFQRGHRYGGKGYSVLDDIAIGLRPSIRRRSQMDGQITQADRGRTAPVGDKAVDVAHLRLRRRRA